MELYITQLIEDLNYVAGHPPERPHIEPPPHLEGDLVIAELALVPFRPIEEWTGINREVFPHMTDLEPGQCLQLNEAILKVYESLNLVLDDMPENIPPEIMYEVLIANWDYPVQYLYSSGMDIGLCTGNPDTCSWSPFCTCNDPEEEDLFYDEEIPGNNDFYNDESEEEYFGDFNSFYDDDGTRVDIGSIPLPSLCVICRLHNADDGEDNLLCLRKRNNQRNNYNFECGMFEKM
jgi:hypothetical protein